LGTGFCGRFPPAEAKTQVKRSNVVSNVTLFCSKLFKNKGIEIKQYVVTLENGINSFDVIAGLHLGKSKKSPAQRNQLFFNCDGKL